jgi:hypothetical protein
MRAKPCKRLPACPGRSVSTAQECIELTGKDGSEASEARFTKCEKAKLWNFIIPWVLDNPHATVLRSDRATKTNAPARKTGMAYAIRAGKACPPWIGDLKRSADLKYAGANTHWTHTN